MNMTTCGLILFLPNVRAEQRRASDKDAEATQTCRERMVPHLLASELSELSELTDHG